MLAAKKKNEQKKSKQNTAIVFSGPRALTVHPPVASNEFETSIFRKKKKPLFYPVFKIHLQFK